MGLIFLERFWFVHIPFGCMVNFQSITQFLFEVSLYKPCPGVLWRNLASLSLKNGGARGVVVIVVGNGHGETSSNPGRD